MFQVITKCHLPATAPSTSNKPATSANYSTSVGWFPSLLHVKSFGAGEEVFAPLDLNTKRHVRARGFSYNPNNLASDTAKAIFFVSDVPDVKRVRRYGHGLEVAQDVQPQSLGTRMSQEAHLIPSEVPKVPKAELRVHLFSHPACHVRVLACYELAGVVT